MIIISDYDRFQLVLSLITLLQVSLLALLIVIAKQTRQTH